MVQLNQVFWFCKTKKLGPLCIIFLQYLMFLFCKVKKFSSLWIIFLSNLMFWFYNVTRYSVYQEFFSKQSDVFMSRARKFQSTTCNVKKPSPRRCRLIQTYTDLRGDGFIPTLVFTLVITWHFAVKFCSSEAFYA